MLTEQKQQHIIFMGKNRKLYETFQKCKIIIKLKSVFFMQFLNRITFVFWSGKNRLRANSGKTELVLFINFIQKYIYCLDFTISARN